MKTTTVCTRHGSYLTVPKDLALRLRPRLRAYFETDAISFEKCVSISGDHDWHVFMAPPKLHAQIRIYIDASYTEELTRLDRQEYDQ